MKRVAGKQMRSVLIVSPYFPPSTLAGVHRARHLVKHLPAAGWKPILLCIDEADHEETLDPALAALVPPETEVVKARALPSWLMRRLGIGDVGLRGWYPMRGHIERLTATRRIDAALITGAPYYPMLLAKTLRARGIPVVLDFQDPWVSTWGEHQPLLSKAGLSHRLATWLEPRALRAASFITSVSEVQNRAMVVRYPWLDPAAIVAIPIGGDPEDFAALHRAGKKPDDELLASGRINLSFVGSYAERFEPVVRALFEAVKHISVTRPELASQLRLNFIGTSALPDGRSAYRVRRFAEEAGVSGIIQESPRRLPYLQALTAMAHSDGLLLIGSDEPHYTASRVYPALMSGRPFLSLYHRDSSAHSILLSAGGGLCFSFSGLDDLQRQTREIAEGLCRLAAQPESLGAVNPVAYARHHASAVAEQFAEVLGAVSKGSPCREAKAVAARARPGDAQTADRDARVCR